MFFFLVFIPGARISRIERATTDVSTDVQIRRRNVKLRPQATSGLVRQNPDPRQQQQLRAGQPVPATERIQVTSGRRVSKLF